MVVILQQIIESIPNILISLFVTSGLVTAAWKLVIKNYFDKGIVSYKNELDTSLEKYKSELNENLHRFSLYEQKKHEIYAEYYSILMYAQSAVAISLKESSDYLFMTEVQVRDSLINLGLSKEEVNIGIGYWEEARKGNQKQFNSFLEKIDYNFAKRKYKEARNYLILNELYFSEIVFSKAKGLEMSLSEILEYRDPKLKDVSTEGETKEARLDIKKARDKVEKAIPELKEMMKKELKEG